MNIPDFFKAAFNKSLTNPNQKNIYDTRDLEVNEITLVHKEEAVPANPKAKVLMYKTASNNIIESTKVFVDGLQKLNSLKADEQTKTEILKKGVDEYIKHLSNSSNSNIDDNTESEGDSETMDPKDLEKIQELFKQGVTPITQSIEELKKSTEQKLDDHSKRLDSLEKQNQEENKPDKTEDQIASASSQESVQENNTKQADENQNVDEAQKAIDDLKKQLDEEKQKILNEDEKFAKTKEELEKIELEALSKSDKINSIQESIERLTKTNNDYNYELNKSMQEGIGMLTELFKAMAKDNKDLSDKVKTLEKSSIGKSRSLDNVFAPSNKTSNSVDEDDSMFSDVFDFDAMEKIANIKRKN